jgi:hypothetical protein
MSEYDATVCQEVMPRTKIVVLWEQKIIVDDGEASVVSAPQNRLPWTFCVAGRRRTGEACASLPKSPREITVL